MKLFIIDKLNVERYIVGPIEENTYLIYESNAKDGIVIDPGYPSNSLLERLKELSFEQITIFITHGHGDHIAGVEFLRENLKNVKVAISLQDLPMLKDSHLNLSVFIGEEIVVNEPEMIIKEGDTFKTGSAFGVAVHIPGHTPGGMALVFENAVFSGDTLFKESVGRSDFDGGDPQKILSAIKTKLLTLSDRVVFPGHGSETSILYEKNNNPYFSDSIFFGY